MAGMFLFCMGCARASSQESPAPANDAVSLAERGIQVGGAYAGDLLGNLSGGMRQGWVYQGKAELTVLADLERALGWNGARLHVHGFNLHNTGRIRRDYVGGVNTIAAIEGVPATRLSELWLEQDFAGGTANLRYGQLAADVEFFYSATSVLFLQSDWATIAALNLPSGGPAYPLSVPGIRLKVDPGAESSLLVAVFNGNPARPGPGD